LNLSQVINNVTGRGASVFIASTPTLRSQVRPYAAVPDRDAMRPHLLITIPAAPEAAPGIARWRHGSGALSKRARSLFCG
jgi:hypothetical protein